MTGPQACLYINHCGIYFLTTQNKDEDPESAGDIQMK
jgi:hypothetical protein